MTFSSLSRRSLNHLKGSRFHHPKKVTFAELPGSHIFASLLVQSNAPREVHQGVSMPNAHGKSKVVRQAKIGQQGWMWTVGTRISYLSQDVTGILSSNPVKSGISSADKFGRCIQDKSAQISKILAAPIIAGDVVISRQCSEVHWYRASFLQIAVFSTVEFHLFPVSYPLSNGWLLAISAKVRIEKRGQKT